MSLRSRRPLSAAVAGLLTVATAACGGDSPSTPTTSPSAGASSIPSAAASSFGQGNGAIVAAANAFLDSLSGTERNSGQFDAGDKAQQQRWSNLPEGLFDRQGLMIGNLDQAKVDAFLAVMRTTLSTEGYNRVMAEWSADDQLATGGGMRYGKKYYWIAIIGEPSTTTSWQWQFGGHHVTINATIKGTGLSLTPSFIGAQPATYTSGGTSVRPLGDITDEAFALVGSLDSADRARAVLGAEAIDLVLGPGQDCRTLQYEGLPGSAMSTAQQAKFVKLIDEYAGLGAAPGRKTQLKAELAKTFFAWYGPTTAGSAAYFRVTGPHVVIEYSPQSMGGETTNHIHGIYRDPTNDYGGTVCGK